MVFVRVRCNFCKKTFLKERKHYNENAQLGHNFYCSRNCLYKAAVKQKELVCGNPTCKKSFFRVPNDISASNYCSTSCAAIVNNKKYPRWPRRFCKECGKEFKNRSSKYCSTECGYKQARKRGSKYNQEQVIEIIQEFHRENGRVPARREALEIAGRAPHMFDSWNNAIEAAGLEPNRSHDSRMYQRSATKAEDGHECDSISEALIDNWLTKMGILHTRDFSYPNTNHKADWAIKDGKIFVEYFGLSKDSPRYDRTIRKKKAICRKHGIKLIEIYPKDIYPKNKLEDNLSTKFKLYLP